MPDQTPRFNGIHIDHPRGGGPSTVTLSIDRRLASGKLDVIPMSEDDLVKLIYQASEKLAILKGVRV